jgi:aminoglycoside 6'-N-acetyltransferase
MDSGSASITSEGNYSIRQISAARRDFEHMATWLSDPRVLEFYEGRDRPFSLEMVRQIFDPAALEEEGVVPAILEYQGQPVGYLQFYPAYLEEYHFDETGTVYGLDLFIGQPAVWGKGVGTAFIRLLLRYLFTEKGADWVILDPHVDNLRAIRAYEKCGFRKIKLLPKHEWHEGSYVDCWLMGVSKP